MWKVSLLILISVLFSAHNSTISNAENVVKKPKIKRLDEKYLNLIDKNGKITNLKEFNKNGYIVVFKEKEIKKNKNNKTNNKMNYLVIIDSDNTFFTCYEPNLKFIKNAKKFVECSKKDGNVHVDFTNFTMHYITPLKYGDYFRGLLTIKEKRELTDDEMKLAMAIQNSLPREVRVKKLDDFTYEKYNLTPDELYEQQAIHLMIKDGTIIYYHRYYANLDKLFKNPRLPGLFINARRKAYGFHQTCCR